MAIKLFEHNLEAYNAAVRMLDTTGKTAVIHPTGTGKSFIGFKLAEDNPDKHIIWLTPSEYIVKTQLENLKKEGGAELDNITFITYAKLMLMSEKEIAALKAEYCVADEFHRIGADYWGQGFFTLYKMHLDMKILGLSATHIRYLDNQRDMAEEIFDGNIASYMTLGEAIVKGIFAPPKYVLSVFSYRKELEKYRKRVQHTRSKAVRDAGEKYLEALRRALEKADGLDTIFYKHMEDKKGKYIVFCANEEHMQEMIEMVPEWFGRVDKNPHIYSAYSSNPETSKEFAGFKADTSNHLKLLFCIDMLNEGIHVDDISGVILLRPTVSPIIYKQQIGRALAAGHKKNTVIFDIVLNFENLYSISDIKEEMNEAIRFYQSTGEEYEIVHDTFTVIDEVRDCKQLFDELERTLSASWECMYNAAKAYYTEHGDLLPPQKYTNDDGYRLGQWVVAQRTAYSNGNLSSSRIMRLEQIGMDWNTAHERLWEEGFAKAKQYADVYGSIASVNYEYKDVSLWVKRQREKYRKNLLSREQYERLSEIGMVWEFEDKWAERYEAAKKYFDEYGNLDIPVGYVAESGIKLGVWYRRIRMQYLDGTMSDERKKLLEDIGINSTSVKIRTWMGYYRAAQQYYEENGDLRISNNYTTDDGMKLGVWISGQRSMYSQHKLRKEQIELLEQIGMIWHGYKSKWETGYSYALQYYNERGDINPAADYLTLDGFALGRWIATQRRKYKNNKLNKDYILQLEQLGIIWDVFSANWETGFKYLYEYYKFNGDALVANNYITDDGYNLGDWVSNQRIRYKKGYLSEERIKKLNSIGFVWEPQKARWQEQFAEAKRYFEKNGSMSVSKNYVTDSGVKLRYWIDTQKKAYKKGTLDSSQIVRLEQIGIV